MITIGDKLLSLRQWECTTEQAAALDCTIYALSGASTLLAKKGLASWSWQTKPQCRREFRAFKARNLQPC